MVPLKFRVDFSVVRKYGEWGDAIFRAACRLVPSGREASIPILRIVRSARHGSVKAGGEVAALALRPVAEAFHRTGAEPCRRMAAEAVASPCAWPSFFQP